MVMWYYYIRLACLSCNNKVIGRTVKINILIMISPVAVAPLVKALLILNEEMKGSKPREGARPVQPRAQPSPLLQPITRADRTLSSTRRGCASASASTSGAAPLPPPACLCHRRWLLCLGFPLSGSHHYRRLAYDSLDLNPTTLAPRSFKRHAPASSSSVICPSPALIWASASGLRVPGVEFLRAMA
ncbi:hypothetical protein EUGRSUZ_E02921 [Eucalyptus grandis]|uniref:Uncharacterized protein n=2 Tax=Eucalyptus grandis TaxID=71139 RepID=A0ACC3KYA6_EUCGR|nr:hypothetical protein EUGRSUZ_E02921 [Eucalyptus grandis]